MKSELNNWDRKIVNTILAYKEYDIIEVREMETVKSLFYNINDYAQIKKLLDLKQHDLIFKIEQPGKESEEYLFVISFKDQNNRLFFATVYDNEELWQDPQIIDLFPQEFVSPGSGLRPRKLK